MSTESQVSANRENAKKSTGPKTKEGKEISSKNSSRSTSSDMIPSTASGYALTAPASISMEPIRERHTADRTHLNCLISITPNVLRKTSSGLLAATVPAVRGRLSYTCRS